jgi:hypothetical protein
MAISFDLPEVIERELRRQVADLDEAAKEATLVEMYRLRRLTHQQLSQALGLSRYETDGLLKRYGVYDDMSAEDVEHDARVSRRARAE